MDRGLGGQVTLSTVTLSTFEHHGLRFPFQCHAQKRVSVVSRRRGFAKYEWSVLGEMGPALFHIGGNAA